MKRKLWLIPVVLAGLFPAIDMANADEIVLTDTPVKITATLQAQEEGSIDARIAVHNGPLAQLVGTTLTGVTLDNAGNALRHQLKWNAPYLLVHSSCNINSARPCEGNVVFKIVKNKVVRLGDFVMTGSPTLDGNRFYDGYDKLGEQADFTIVMVEVNDALQINADATWAYNAANQKIYATRIASEQPARDWNDGEWDKYFDAVVNNAALARYCNRSEELQQLLDAVNPLLDAEHKRMLTDTLSKVVPLEMPKAWRNPF